jgi:hypothetical protein
MVPHEEQYLERLAIIDRMGNESMKRSDSMLILIQARLYEEEIVKGREEVHGLRQWLAVPLKQGRPMWNVMEEFARVLEAIGRLKARACRLWIEAALRELTEIQMGMTEWG